MEPGFSRVRAVVKGRRDVDLQVAVTSQRDLDRGRVLGVVNVRSVILVLDGVPQLLPLPDPDVVVVMVSTLLVAEGHRDAKCEEKDLYERMNDILYIFGRDFHCTIRYLESISYLHLC